MKRIRNHLVKHGPFYLFLCLYTLFLVIINPTYNFPINDDWDRVIQLLAFQNGDFRIHSVIDNTFILQPWIGFIWVQVFGISFVSMRALTILFTFLLAVFFYKLFPELGRKDSFLLLAAFFLHPLVLASSLTFMTEIYFLFFILLSYIYYQKLFVTENIKALYLGSVFLASSILLKQVGYVLVVAVLVTFGVNYGTKLYKNKKLATSTKKILLHFVLSLLIIGLATAIAQFYPRAGSGQGMITQNFVSTDKIAERLLEMAFILPLIGFTVAPLVLTIKKKVLALLTVPALLLALPVYKLGVLPLGNIFYLNGLYDKSGRHIYSLFNNHLFKFGIAFLIALSLLALCYLIVTELIKKKHLPNLFLTLIILGFYAITFFPEDIFDRYAIPLLMFLLIFIVKELNVRKISTAITVLILIISLVLTYEFYAVRTLQTKQVEALMQQTGNVSTIYSFDTLRVYHEAMLLQDYAGDRYDEYEHSNIECLVQQYTVDQQYSILAELSKKADEVLSKKIENPKNYGYSKRELSWIKNNLDILIFNEEYFSPLYAATGKKAYVGTYCPEKK